MEKQSGKVTVIFGKEVKNEKPVYSAKTVPIGYFLGRRENNGDLILFQKNYECLVVVEDPNSTWSAVGRNADWHIYDYQPVNVKVYVDKI